MPTQPPVSLAAALLVATLACGGRSDTASRTQSVSKVVTSDVHNFVVALDKWTPADTSCRGVAAYLNAASPGLVAYRDKFDMQPTDLCHAMRRDPKRYAALRMKLSGIDSAQQAIETAFVKFAALSPGARLPSVYFVVGDEISGGTTTGGRAPIVLVGAELLGSLTGLPVLTVHEFVHTQQHYPILKVLAAGPSFVRGTVLAQSIKEGSANFLAELATGQKAAPSLQAYGDAHEQEIWRDFERDMHGKDYSRWLYNGRDIGYYVGYRITKAYYDKAADKRRAIREILNISNFDDFLQESGYDGGGKSDQ